MAGWAGGGFEPTVQGEQCGFQGFGKGNVPSVVRGDRVAQLPDSIGERLVGEEIRWKVEEVGIGEGGDVG